jgi:hypothetical protein
MIRIKSALAIHFRLEELVKLEKNLDKTAVAVFYPARRTEVFAGDGWR